MADYPICYNRLIHMTLSEQRYPPMINIGLTIMLTLIISIHIFHKFGDFGGKNGELLNL